MGTFSRVLTFQCKGHNFHNALRSQQFRDWIIHIHHLNHCSVDSVAQLHSDFMQWMVFNVIHTLNNSTQMSKWLLANIQPERTSKHLIEIVFTMRLEIWQIYWSILHTGTLQKLADLTNVTKIISRYFKLFVIRVRIESEVAFMKKQFLFWFFE